MAEDNLFTGSLDAAAAAIEQRWDDAAEPVETEGQPEVTDEVVEEIVEDDVEETESEADEEVEAEAALEADDDDTPIETVADLAEALDVPVEELLENFRTTIKVDGETSEVSLKELAAGYQKDADYRQKTESLSREREEFAEERRQQVARWEAENQQNAFIVSQFEQAIVAEMQSEQLSQLRQENETAWLARRQELQDQLNGLNRVRAEAGQRWQMMKDQMDQQDAMVRQQSLAKEMDLLNTAIPSWDKDMEKSLTEYLIGAGYSPERLSMIDNHLDLVMAHKAMMYDKAQAESEVVAKKVKKAPKIQKPGTRKTVSKNDLRSLKARVKKSGDVNDAAAAIEQMI